MGEKDVMIKTHRERWKYYNEWNSKKYVSEHLFQCAIIPADKQNEFECGGTNISSSVKFWILLFWSC